MARIKMHIPKAKLPFYPPCEVKCRLQNEVSTAKQQFGHNEFHILELPGNWEPPDSVYIAQLRATMESLYCHLGGD